MEDRTFSSTLDLGSQAFMRELEIVHSGKYEWEKKGKECGKGKSSHPRNVKGNFHLKSLYKSRTLRNNFTRKKLQRSPGKTSLERGGSK